MNPQTDLLHFSRHHGNPVWLSLWEKREDNNILLRVEFVCLSVRQSFVPYYASTSCESRGSSEPHSHPFPTVTCTNILRLSRLLTSSLSLLLTHTLFLTHARNPLRDRRNPPPPSPSEDAANVRANNDFKMRRDALDSPMNPSINSGIRLKRTKTKQLTQKWRGKKVA